MKSESQAKAVAIFIGETDRWHGKPLAAAIVERARESGLAGATVIHGQMGFGASSRIHSTHILSLSEDLPVVVYIIDAEEKVRPFLAVLDEMVDEGLVASWDVTVHRYVHSEAGTDKR